MRHLALLSILAALFLFIACKPTSTLDEQLQQVIKEQSLTAFDSGPSPDMAMVALGQALFFDKELSGNRDIACATCHHPTQSSGDGLPVSIGTGGTGLGPERHMGYGRSFIPRNAPEVFNRGSSEWTTMFWDSRVADRGQFFISPAGNQLPDGLDNVLAVQAMFPVTSSDEMRGAAGDISANGDKNELALYDDADLTGIWQGLMDRILSHPEYVTLFEAAYPHVAVADLGFEHAANAIAAFEIKAYTLPHSPWQYYLQGDLEALTDAQKEGALLFFGAANCAACHNGPLLTDQQHHTLAVPQVGPGKGEQAPLDLGRWRESQDMSDMYAFRTPSLHNVAVSGPYMHDGAFLTLEAAIRHHLDPEESLRNYDPALHMIPELHETFQNDPDLIADMLDYIDPNLAPARELTAVEVQNLMAFLHALTDPAVNEMEAYVPDSVPSGLPVEDTLGRDAN